MVLVLIGSLWLWNPLGIPDMCLTFIECRCAEIQETRDRGEWSTFFGSLLSWALGGSVREGCSGTIHFLAWL